MLKAGRPFLADPILEPIHHGFVDSIARYRDTRARWPEIDMMMGTGNLTELTEADSLGVTALLVGMCSELSIGNVLIVQVSNHTRRTVEEHDAARRIMYAAKPIPRCPRDTVGRCLPSTTSARSCRRPTRSPRPPRRCATRITGS